MNARNQSIMLLVFAFASPFASPTPAFAAMTCTNTLGKIVIPNNLIVPAGQTCRLNGTEVDGDVIVEDGARLFTSNDAYIDGKLMVSTNASANLSQTRVDGTIELLDSRQLIVTNSELDGGAKSTNTKTISLSGTFIDGDVDISEQTNLTIRQVNTISGFKIVNINSFKLFNSTLAGNVEVESIVNRIEICGNNLGGSAKFSKNAGVFQFGGAAVSQPCTDNQIGKNTVTGNVEILDNTANAVVANNEIVGNLSCGGNSPAPRGGNNTVIGGSKEGQCAAL